jgi:hypothetical protein
MRHLSKNNATLNISTLFNVYRKQDNLPSKLSASLIVSKQRVSPNSIITSPILSYISETGTENVYISSAAHVLLMKTGSSLDFSGIIISVNFQVY